VYAESQIPPLRVYKFVTPGLLKTMGNSVVAGRDLTWTDIYEKRNVVMVTENLARELWRQPSAAIGKRIRENLKGPWREVVGRRERRAGRRREREERRRPYWPVLMSNFRTRDVRVALAGLHDPEQPDRLEHIHRRGRQAVWSVNSNLPLANVRTLQEVYDASLARTSFTLVMLAIAGAMALLLGIAGSTVSSCSFSADAKSASGSRWARGTETVTRMFSLTD
jgi:hypothetical protein